MVEVWDKYLLFNDLDAIATARRARVDIAIGRSARTSTMVAENTLFDHKLDVKT